MVALLIALAVVVQVTLLSRLGLPAATPDLVLVMTAAVGCARGSAAGAAAGFGGGLLLDLAPPADHPAGQWAIVLTVVGHVAGRFGAAPEEAGRGLFRPGATSHGTGGVPRRLALITGLAAGATVAYLVVSGALGAGWAAPEQLGVLAVAAGGYAACLAAPLLPLTDWALTRTSRGPTW